MSCKVGISFGVLAPKIALQLREHGLIASAQHYRAWERQREAVMTLRFARLIPESQVDKALRTLLQDIVSNVRERVPSKESK